LIWSPLLTVIVGTSSAAMTPLLVRQKRSAAAAKLEMNRLVIA
jgi:hypothetical protein